MEKILKERKRFGELKNVKIYKKIHNPVFIVITIYSLDCMQFLCIPYVFLMYSVCIP